MEKAITSITIFLSYCHVNKGVAEKIEADLKMMGIRVIRDAHQLKYTDSIGEFMQNIRKADYALLLISDPYLRSRNCMFEVSQLLKDLDAWHKLLPVIVGETKIYTPVERLEYIKYWQDQQTALKTGLLDIDTTNALSSYSELKQLGQIAGLTDDFLSRIVNMYHVNYQALIEQKYKPLFDKLGCADISFLTSLLSIKEIHNPEIKGIALDDYLTRFGPNTFYYCFRANLDKRLGQYNKAIYSYQQALALDPDNVEALNNYGFLLLELSADLDVAKSMLEKVVTIQPNMAIARINLGVVYERLKQPDLARVQYEQVLTIEPANAKAHHNLGNYYKGPLFRDDSRAEYHFRRAMKLDPSYFEPVFGYANFLKCNLKQVKEGNKYYRKAKKLDRTGKFRDLINGLLKTDKG